MQRTASATSFAPSAAEAVRAADARKRDGGRLGGGIRGYIPDYDPVPSRAASGPMLHGERGRLRSQAGSHRRPTQGGSEPTATFDVP